MKLAANPVEVPQPRWNEVAREFTLRRDAAIIRGPVEWSWDVTNQCPGRCLHCFNRSGVLTRDELSDDEMMDVARQIAEMSPLGICLCGGEPLLRAKTALKAAGVLSQAGVGVNMVTNGLLVTRELASAMSDAGIAMVQVSLDGADATSHERLRMVPGLFDAAVRAIEIMRSAELGVGVSFTPTRWNISQWPRVYDLARSMGVYELRIQPLMPLGACQINYSEMTPTEDQYRELVSEYKALLFSSKCEMEVEWGDPVDHMIRFGQYYSMIPYTMHISSDGYLMPSVYLPIVLGNIRRHRIDEYWQAGLNTAWQVRLVRELAYRVRCNRDFGLIRPHPFYDAPVDLDLLDRSREEIEHVTDVVLDFVERVAPPTSRPTGPWQWQPSSTTTRRGMTALFGERPGPQAVDIKTSPGEES